MGPVPKVDLSSWDELAAYCSEVDGLEPEQRVRAADAFRFLKTELGGDGFLYRAYRKPRHPLTTWTMNPVPYAYAWIEQFADCLQTVRDSCNYSSLMKKIRSAERFEMEGWPELLVASRLAKAGLCLTFEPRPDGPSGKKPDIQAHNRDTGEDLFVEVKVLNTSKEAMNAYHAFHKIGMPLVLASGIDFAGSILCSMSAKDADDLTERVSQLIAEVRSSQRFATLIEPGVIQLGIAPHGDKDFERWKRESGSGHGFGGFLPDTDEAQRMRSAVSREQGQLPRDRPGVVVVINYGLSSEFLDRERMVDLLEAEVDKHDRIVAVIILSPLSKVYGAPGRDEMSTVCHHFVRLNDDQPDRLGDTTMVMSRLRMVQVHDKTLGKVKAAFLGHDPLE